MLAQAAAAPAGALDALVQAGGIVGPLLALVLFALWKLYARIIANADEHRQRADRAEEEIRKLNADMRDRVLVSVADATHALKDVLTVLGKGTDR